MYSFTFRQIEVFLEICSVGNFSAAAARLDVSQPAISNVIRSLESQLGAELFERRRGASCVLTRDGQAFRDCARLFIAQCDAIGSATRTQRRRQRPLRVYIGGHLLEDFVRPLLPELYEEHPQLRMSFLPETSRETALRDIPSGKVDIAVVTVPASERPAGSLHIATVPAGVYGPRSFRGPYNATTVSALPFLLPAAGTQLTASMLRELEKHDVRPQRITHQTWHDVRVRLASRGKGVTFTAQTVIDRHDPQGRLHLLFPTEPWEQRLYINPRVERASATAIASFISRALNATPRQAQR